MEYTRILKRGSSGEDVRYVKDRLVELGYLEKATHNRFGSDTLKAVKAFQDANGLDVDGKVGQLTWAALFNESGEEESAPKAVISDLPDHISKTKRNAIAKDLTLASETRQKIVKAVLEYTTDPDVHDYIRAFYIRGGNLFDSSLKPYKMSIEKLTKYFNNSSYAPYYDGGRKEMMLAMAKEHDYSICGSDCSGTVVGVWRKIKVVSSGFDANANRLYNNYCTQTKNPQPGDLAWRNGHIGIYVGGGYIAENIGGAFGLQLTKANKRQAYSFMDKKLHKFSAWTAYGDPKQY